MTVEALDASEQVICTWFEGKKKKQDHFLIAALETASKGVDAIAFQL